MGSLLLHRAFSLVELVVVMVILGIVAAVAIPRIADSVAGQRVDMAARRLNNDFVVVREMARSGSQSYTMTFDSSALSYEIKGDTTSVVLLGREPYGLTRLDASFGDSGSTEITVDGYGTWGDGGTVRLASGNRTVSVVVGVEESRVVKDERIVDDVVKEVGATASAAAKGL
ncbi:MAG: type II secretion system protein [Planctomycetota bacterium]